MRTAEPMEDRGKVAENRSILFFLSLFLFVGFPF